MEINLEKVQCVLVEISTEKNSPLDSGWSDLSDILTTIKKDCDFALKLREIFTWIIKHPRHTYPRHLHGWTNLLIAQFCSPVNANKIVLHMIQLGILNVLHDKTCSPVLITGLDHKRCREIINDDSINHCKRSRIMDVDDFSDYTDQKEK